MVEIRFHGRGGQGAVTSAELLAKAAIAEGRYAQAFPAFGAERRGAPVQAFTRISDEPIKIRIGIYEPDIVVVLDPTLLRTIPVLDGLKEGGILVLNAKWDVKEVRERLGWKGKLAVVDATKIALEELGVPITNVVMLGALLKARGDLASLEDVEKEIADRFPKIKDMEIKAFRRAYEEAVIDE
ncbi:pyruvate ferredoxin oxidoreductase, gamma subunit [Thermosulfidibacter takaii ABI70S6]|uniref:Pyruvate ferredoxin oxidoreductase, gamma subunit n=1 Tax=Thermosulfidibacter takaii (strain DSM 17441 / JCM 13301 / NBRC 103674 / ABI70S6) TaxID=1298851 RepID=A0A0S3QR67_THET7|nr:2-oxoacid:acceptor oxidoreductase family protein [Thermosulfidibacter takaii]BAT70827.1 pyruvate ferredoxin oxidoreductase, gamma subunit [Thermosulfidibacter takaii ABI70S6]